MIVPLTPSPRQSVPDVEQVRVAGSTVSHALPDTLTSDNLLGPLQDRDLALTLFLRYASRPPNAT
jgi:hypothetical protein